VAGAPKKDEPMPGGGGMCGMMSFTTRISLLSPDGENRKMLCVSARNPASGGVSFCR
jgi:hypothetical protein